MNLGLRTLAACHETLPVRDASRGGGGERHDEPQPFEAAGQIANRALRVEGIEIGGAGGRPWTLPRRRAARLHRYEMGCSVSLRGKGPSSRLSACTERA